MIWAPLTAEKLVFSRDLLLKFNDNNGATIVILLCKDF
jgi:hypothetical protein